MRLKKDQIQKITEKVLKALEDQKLVKLKAPRTAVLDRIHKAIFDDLAAEDRLDEDAKNLMEKYRSQLPPGANQQELLNKIKKQLATERKIVL
ncbi:MAG: DUF507 family protein [Deltaproteobacteria bacterium]|nr:DUF507 family protein [Deltaproteobacteria bacterium]